MPGMASWEGLYKLEYLALYEEGYPVGEKPKADMHGVYIPFPGDSDGKASVHTAEEWEKVYRELWKIRRMGLRKDYPFVEPTDYVDIILQGDLAPELVPLTDEEYYDRLSGAWHGRCAAITLGKPLERGMSKEDIKKYLSEVDAYPLRDWVPHREDILGDGCRDCCKGGIRYVPPDDDVHYTIQALMLAERYGLAYTKEDWLKNLIATVPYTALWSCTKQSYYHYINLDENRPLKEQIDEFPYKLNPMREGINPVIRVDFWGYISPADIRRASMLAYKDASVNAAKNGVYASMFIAACLSAALSKNPTVETILQAGKSVIPKRSRLARAVSDVEEWYREARDWEAVCDKIYEKYGHLPFAGGINNMAINVLALLHGGLDYEKTVTTAVMCGMDTDCNAGTTGSIVGAAIGFEKLDKKWVAPFNNRVKTLVAGFGEGRITDVVDRIYKVYQKTKNTL